MAICTDDGFTYWREGAVATELGIPVVVVNHAVSELPGVASLGRHIEEYFPGVPVHHIEQQSMFRLIQ
jgi:putative NIF3 family GTP cyclohydrolase 1 type 2